MNRTRGLSLVNRTITAINDESVIPSGNIKTEPVENNTAPVIDATPRMLRIERSPCFMWPGPEDRRDVRPRCCARIGKGNRRAHRNPNEPNKENEPIPMPVIASDQSDDDDSVIEVASRENEIIAILSETVNDNDVIAENDAATENQLYCSFCNYTAKYTSYLERHIASEKHRKAKDKKEAEHRALRNSS